MIWYDSPMSCMSPYSIPLCTIFTKCPAPSEPTQSQHGVPSATLAAMAWKMGLTCGHAARHARADVEHPLRLHVLRAAHGVREVRVAAVDEDVPLLEQREQLFDEV